MQIKTNDALIAQHVLDLVDCSIATDNVRDFKKVPGITIIPLRSE
jgi:predicted nucleic acid-binding protein